MPQLPAILLAAGCSSRMGDFKPLLRLAGTPILHRVIAALRASGAIGDILLVTGHRAPDIEASLRDLPPGEGGRGAIRTVHNPHYATGEMRSSLLAGLSALPPAAPAFLLALADQPAVQPTTITALVNAYFTPASSTGLANPPAKKTLPGTQSAGEPAMQSAHPALVIPITLGKRGHPVVLSTTLAPEIRSLTSAESLKTVVHRHLDAATLVPVDDPSIHDDLDTPADFARAQAQVSLKN
jgi:molybdenum cofactor cytidylyltransferase